MFQQTIGIPVGTNCCVVFLLVFARLFFFVCFWFVFDLIFFVCVLPFHNIAYSTSLDSPFLIVPSVQVFQL